MTGYGRGYYGDQQLAPRRSGSGWFTAAVVAGLGALVWFMLPRIGPKHEQQPPASPPPDDPLEQLARARGFASGKIYEDALVASAKELKTSGAHVTLPPYFEHLGPRVDS